MIDCHVHFNEPGREDWEGFETGSQMMAAGGCTTYFDMPLNCIPSTVTAEHLLAKAELGRQKSAVDFALWGGLVPGHIEDIRPMAEAGAIGFKAFLSKSGTDEFRSVDERTLLKGMAEIAAAAGIAIVLTTFFAFFLSSRVTYPLRKMREGAQDLAKGKFDTKIPILTQDEIGELATAFNQMGRQLNFHINALNQEKEQLSNILSSMADGVITINIDGTILVTNPPAERFLQAWYYEQNMNIKEGDNLPPEAKELFQNAVSTEKEQMIEMTLQGRSWVLLMSPLYAESHVRGAVAVLRDMTEERRLDKLREDFIANVSHELRTPISMLQGYSEAIVDDIASSEEDRKEIAQIIYDESLRMGRLVNDLLDLARMESAIQAYIMKKSM